MSLPNTYTNKNETGCCAVPNFANWDEKEVTMVEKPFIRLYTSSFLHIPLNMSKVMTKLQKIANDAGALMPTEAAMILSRDLSPWKAEQLYAVSKPIPGADNVILSGNFLTQVFEGPYQNAKKWYDSLQDYAKSEGKTIDRTYFFYMTCPKCAKYYGTNYTTGLARIQ